MKILLGLICAIFFIIPDNSAFGQYRTNVGSGGVAITPRGINFKERPELMRLSGSSVTIESTRLDMPLEKAVGTLKETNIITSAKLGNAGEISVQSLALASLVYYTNKSTAVLKAAEIFNFAKSPEGRIYAVMAVYKLDGLAAARKLAAVIPETDELAVMMGAKLHKVGSGKFFEEFFKNPELFIPDVAILRRKNTIKTYDSGAPVYVSPPPVIIIPKCEAHK